LGLTRCHDPLGFASPKKNEKKAGGLRELGYKRKCPIDGRSDDSKNTKMKDNDSKQTEDGLEELNEIFEARIEYCEEAGICIEDWDA
jgi:hypothetical protein